jgi:hypothetical protein
MTRNKKLEAQMNLPIARHRRSTCLKTSSATWQRLSSICCGTPPWQMIDPQPDQQEMNNECECQDNG